MKNFISLFNYSLSRYASYVMNGQRHWIVLVRLIKILVACNLAVDLFRLTRTILMLYQPHRYKNKTWLPYRLIKQATDEGWLKSLAYFVQLRKFYRKPIFYNYSIRSLSRRLNCSPSTISKHIEILSQRGLIQATGGHLRLRGSTSLKIACKSGLVPVKIAKKRADQFMLLRYVLINRNLHNQANSIQDKKNIIKMHNGKYFELPVIKRLLRLEQKLGGKEKVETSINDKLMLSNKKVGAICNRSQGTGVKIQKALNRLKVVATKRNTVLACKQRFDKRSFFELNLPSAYLLSTYGFVFHSLPNQWSIKACIQ